MIKVGDVVRIVDVLKGDVFVDKKKDHVGFSGVVTYVSKGNENGFAGRLRLLLCDDRPNPIYYANIVVEKVG